MSAYSMKELAAAVAEDLAEILPELTVGKQVDDTVSLVNQSDEEVFVFRDCGDNIKVYYEDEFVGKYSDDYIGFIELVFTKVASLG